MKHFIHSFPVKIALVTAKKLAFCSGKRQIEIKKKILLLMIMLCFSTVSFSQWVVTDFYNGIINTVSQTIQAASKIINSEEFKHVVKVYVFLAKTHRL